MTRQNLSPTVLRLAIVLLSAIPLPAVASEFESNVKTFLKQHCLRCHSAGKRDAQLDLQKLATEINPADASVWEAIAEQVGSRSMPPKDEPRPTDAEITTFLKWIRQSLKSVETEISTRKSVFPEDGNLVPHDRLFAVITTPATPPATTARIWRVRPSIYESFVQHASREPFHHPFKRESLYSTPWGLEGDGFKDYSDLYWIGEAETELLISNAMRAAGNMSRKRSSYSGESKVFRSFLSSRQEPTNEAIQTVINEAFAQILQRPPTDEEASRYLGFMKQNMADLGRELGMQTTFAALLLHPKALFRFELGHGESDQHGRVQLAPAELAYALAYSITDSVPDEKLMDAAGDGELTTHEQIESHIIRLIDLQQAKMQKSYRTPGVGRRFNAPMLRFFQEYFGYTKAPQVFKDIATKRKAKLGGNYSPEALVSDTNLLVLHFLANDRDVLKQLLTTDLSFVSTGRGRWNGLVELKKRAQKSGTARRITPFDDKRNRIFEHYNIQPDDWSEDMPFPLDKTQRAGILTQPSWLIAHSTNFENHAIHRGKWIRERLLGGTIPDTPITVDAQLADDETLTLRERMHVTRESFCWKCHQQMDPLGLPFEMFDHFGRHRTTELNKPVDSSGKVTLSGDSDIDGPVENAVELMHRLGSSRRVQQVFVRHAFRFFLGRNESVDDAPTLIAAERDYSESGGSMKALVTSLLTSDSFLYRQQPATASEQPALSRTETRNN